MSFESELLLRMEARARRERVWWRVWWRRWLEDVVGWIYGIVVIFIVLPAAVALGLTALIWLFSAIIGDPIF